MFRICQVVNQKKNFSVGCQIFAMSTLTCFVIVTVQLCNMVVGVPNVKETRISFPPDRLSYRRTLDPRHSEAASASSRCAVCVPIPLLSAYLGVPTEEFKTLSIAWWPVQVQEADEVLAGVNFFCLCLRMRFCVWMSSGDTLLCGDQYGPTSLEGAAHKIVLLCLGWGDQTCTPQTDSQAWDQNSTAKLHCSQKCSTDKNTTKPKCGITFSRNVKISKIQNNSKMPQACLVTAECKRQDVQ